MDRSDATPPADGLTAEARSAMGRNGVEWGPGSTHLHVHNPLDMKAPNYGDFYPVFGPAIPNPLPSDAGVIPRRADDCSEANVLPLPPAKVAWNDPIFGDEQRRPANFDLESVRPQVCTHVREAEQALRQLGVSVCRAEYTDEDIQVKCAVCNCVYHWGSFGAGRTG